MSLHRQQLGRPAQVVTPPAVRFLEDAHVWEQLRVPLEGSPAAPADAALIALYRDAVEAALDGPAGELGRALITQTLRMELDAFPVWCGAAAWLKRCSGGRGGSGGHAWSGRDAPILLPAPPLQAVTEVSYLDEAGMSRVLPAESYRVIDNGVWPSEIEPAYGTTWPATRAVAGAVTVTWTAGYGDAASDVPGDIVAAGLLLVTDLYEHRSAQEVGVLIAKNPAVERLLFKRRVARFG